jgi:hypothetical protein
MADRSITTYGDRNPRAPKELEVFAFLIGKWQGEHYLVADRDDFVYRLDASSDGGRTWNEGHIEMTFRRTE